MHSPTLKLGSSFYLPSLCFKSNKKSVYKHFVRKRIRKELIYPREKNNYWQEMLERLRCLIKSRSLGRSNLFYRTNERSGLNQSLYSFFVLFFNFFSQVSYNPEAVTINSNDKEPGPWIWKDQVLVWLSMLGDFRTIIHGIFNNLSWWHLHAFENLAKLG